MMMNRCSIALLLLLNSSVLLSQVSGDAHGNATAPAPAASAPAPAAAPTGKMNLVELAEKNGFTILVAAVKAAGLADALAADGPLTIMAPNDDAFAAAFKALGITAEQALALPNLGDILKYHAVSGKVMAKDVTDGMEATTLQGEKFTVNMKDGKVTISGGDILPAATVISADVEASNGVVHVIDQVLIPPTVSAALKKAAADGAGAKKMNLVELAVESKFTTLVAAVKAAGLVDALSGDGPLTIMAPTDDAFAAAFKALGITAEQALALPNLGDILKYHAVSGTVMAKDVKDGMEVPTLQGEKFTVNVKGDKVTITGGDILPAATVISADAEASNGVAHVIDQVLIPPTISAALKKGAAAPGGAAGGASAPAPAPDASVDQAGRSLKAMTGLVLGLLASVSAAIPMMHA